MYCKFCGAENKDDAAFCTSCGKQLGAGQVTDVSVDVPETQAAQAMQAAQATPAVMAKKSGKTAGLIVGLVIAAFVLCIGGVVGVMLFQRHQEQLRIQEEQAKWEAYVSETEEWLENTETQVSVYVLSDAEKSSYSELVKALQNGLANKAKEEKLDAYKEELESLLEEIYEENVQQVNAYMERLKNADVRFAAAADMDVIQNYQSQVAALVEEQEFAKAFSLLQEWDSYVVPLGMAPETYSVSVKQYDISNFPRVKLYLDVTDAQGNFVDNLSSSAFYVNEGRTINGDFSRATVVSAAKLNDNAGISICLAADISGSMYDSMDQAKQAMSNFINSVQFDKGDQIELTEFSEFTYICRSFTNDKSALLSSINQMSAGGTTRLYDTLISEVERVQSQDNAKCIIGFTDGYDNESVYSAEDVIDVAVANQIPIFLIGIGSDCDSAVLGNIARSTGGTYENINNIDSLESIYNSIYRQEKEVYLLEYEVSDGDNFDDRVYTDVYIRADENNGGFVENFAFEPRDFFDVMYNKFLIAGIDCQTKGERNLLDSGLIVTSDAAYADPNCVAYQSQASINSGGVGSKDSSTFEVLVYYDVLSVEKDGDGYIVYGVSNYDISKIRKFSGVKNDKEKELIDYYYGYVDDSQEFWIEENISNYEKLTLIKDTDGKWKFNTRVYERADGQSAVTINTVYNVMMTY